MFFAVVWQNVPVLSHCLFFFANVGLILANMNEDIRIPAVRIVIIVSFVVLFILCSYLSKILKD